MVIVELLKADSEFHFTKKQTFVKKIRWSV